MVFYYILTVPSANSFENFQKKKQYLQILGHPCKMNNTQLEYSSSYMGKLSTWVWLPKQNLNNYYKYLGQPTCQMSKPNGGIPGSSLTNLQLDMEPMLVNSHKGQ